MTPVQSHLTCHPRASLRPCLPSPPLESARGMAGGMLRHPQLPGESSLWLCNLHQRCFLKHYCPMWTLPACRCPLPRGAGAGQCNFPQPRSVPAPRTVLLPRQRPSPASQGTVATRAWHGAGATVTQWSSPCPPDSSSLCFGTSGLQREQGSHPTPPGYQSIGAQSLEAWADSGHATMVLPAGARLARSWQRAVRVDVRILLHFAWPRVILDLCAALVFLKATTGVNIHDPTRPHPYSCCIPRLRGPCMLIFTCLAACCPGRWHCTELEVPTCHWPGLSMWCRE